MSSETLDRVIAAVARTFDCQAETLGATSSAIDVDGWDSVSHTMLMLELEDEFGVVLDFEAVQEADSLGALAAYIHTTSGK